MQPKDPTFLNDFEKKHIPEVILPKRLKAGVEMEITVKIGEIPHPMMPEHFITWVAIYEGDKLLKKNKLEPETPPETVFKLKFDSSKQLRCLEECSIHGIWEKKFNIIFKQAKPAK